MATTTRYLLALGDSLAAGYQPTDGTMPPPTNPSTGYPDHGYPGGYAAVLASTRHLTLIDLACPGETTASMTGSPAEGQCTKTYRAEFDASSQLAAAMTFLGLHRREVSLVTLDLGANNIDGCCLRAALISTASKPGRARRSVSSPPLSPRSGL